MEYYASFNPTNFIPGLSYSLATVKEFKKLITRRVCAIYQRLHTKKIGREGPGWGSDLIDPKPQTCSVHLLGMLPFAKWHGWIILLHTTTQAHLCKFVCEIATWQRSSQHSYLGSTLIKKHQRSYLLVSPLTPSLPNSQESCPPGQGNPRSQKLLSHLLLGAKKGKKEVELELEKLYSGKNISILQT